MQILTLVNDKLEVDFDVGQSLHAHQPRLLALVRILLPALTDGPIENGLDVVDDIFEHLVMHLGEDDYLEERLDGAQYFVRVGSNLIHQEVTDALVGALPRAAWVHRTWLRGRVATLLTLMLLQ